MITSQQVRTLATMLARTERIADPGNPDDLRRRIVSQMALVAGLLLELRGSGEVPGSARMLMSQALEAVERAARQVDQHIQDGDSLFP